MDMIFSRSALAEIDRRAIADYHIPILVLMENAGRAVADMMSGYVGPGENVLILIGPGNNGGDGLVVARHLHNAGIQVQILSIAPLSKFRDAPALHLQTIQAMGIPVGEIDASLSQLRDWLATTRFTDDIVDAMFGTGLSREVSGVARQVIETINASNRTVYAVDIPSGLDCDTGAPLGTAIRANLTISFCGHKRGFANARDYTGEVIIGDIGAPKELLNELQDS